jgi:hypothetical protein
MHALMQPMISSEAALSHFNSSNSENPLQMRLN